MYQELIEGGKDHVILFLATEALDLLITEWEKGEEKAGESLKSFKGGSGAGHWTQVRKMKGQGGYNGVGDRDMGEGLAI